MKENIKIGLMAIIAVTLIVNTMNQGSGGMMMSSDDSSSSNDVAPTTVNPPSNNAQVQANEPIVPKLPKTKISFAELEHNFGDVEQETQNTHIFRFSNTGDKPLVISDAKGSCGCTVPNYPREPIAPGESGEIEVVYSPGKQKNQQTKTVTITANTTPETSLLKITANVLETEGGGDE